MLLYLKKFEVLIMTISAWLVSISLAQVNEWLQFLVLLSGLGYTIWKWFFRNSKK